MPHSIKAALEAVIGDHAKLAVYRPDPIYTQLGVDYSNLPFIDYEGMGEGRSVRHFGSKPLVECNDPEESCQPLPYEAQAIILPFLAEVASSLALCGYRVSRIPLGSGKFVGAGVVREIRCQKSRGVPHFDSYHHDWRKRFPNQPLPKAIRHLTADNSIQISFNRLVHRGDEDGGIARLRLYGGLSIWSLLENGAVQDQLIDGWEIPTDLIRGLPFTEYEPVLGESYVMKPQYAHSILNVGDGTPVTRVTASVFALLDKSTSTAFLYN
jgi:hypothetical protein